MKTLTIRNIPPELDEALAQERARSGRSLNQTVIDLLRQRLGVGTTRSNGLARLSGGWSAEDARRFADAVAPFEHVDEDVWR